MDDWLVLELFMDSSLNVQVVPCLFCIGFAVLYQYSHESSSQHVKNAVRDSKRVTSKCVSNPDFGILDCNNVESGRRLLTFRKNFCFNIQGISLIYYTINCSHLFDSVSNIHWWGGLRSLITLKAIPGVTYLLADNPLLNGLLVHVRRRQGTYRSRTAKWQPLH
jgi:hypothetical protein